MSETLGEVSERSRDDDRWDLGGEELGKESVEITREEEEEFSDNKSVLEICRKRKRSDEEEEEDHVEEDNDGFKTPTRPENRIPEIRECPPAPKRRTRTEYSEMFRGKTTSSCRRRLSFSPEDSVNSFIKDLQWRTTTMTIKK